MGKKKRNSIMYLILRFFWKSVLFILKIIWNIIKIIFKWIFHSKSHQKCNLQKGGLKVKKDDYEPLQEIKKISGSSSEFERKLLLGKSTIGIIIGARGSGKSAIGMRIVENIKEKTKKKIYAMGFNRNFIPNWISISSDLNEVDNNSVLIVDESGITFSSRNSMSEINKLISSILLIARHKDISVIFITQNSSNLEINTIRQADYLILKPHSLLQLDFERKKIREIYKEVEHDFKKFKDIKGIAYIYSDQLRGFVSNTLPTFWSSGLSKSFSDKNMDKNEEKN
ncbi:MAG: zonular occludens toxin domain-containing protein [archaeon]